MKSSEFNILLVRQQQNVAKSILSYKKYSSQNMFSLRKVKHTLKKKKKRKVFHSFSKAFLNNKLKFFTWHFVYVGFLIKPKLCI